MRLCTHYNNFNALLNTSVVVVVIVNFVPVLVSVSVVMYNVSRVMRKPINRAVQPQRMA